MNSFVKPVATPEQPAETQITQQETQTTTQETQQLTAAVDISNFAFTPSNLAVKVGTVVTFTNHDATSHTVTGDSGLTLQSSTLLKDKIYTMTFTKVGTFGYHCNFHPFMTGMVTVTE